LHVGAFLPQKEKEKGDCSFNEGKTSVNKKGILVSQKKITDDLKKDGGW